MRRDDSGGGQGATREQKTCESCGKARIPSTWSTCNKCAKTSQRKRAREAKDGISDHFWKEYPEERRRDSSQAQCEKLLEAFSDGRAKNELRRLPHWGRAKVAKTAALDAQYLQALVALQAEGKRIGTGEGQSDWVPDSSSPRRQLTLTINDAVAKLGGKFGEKISGVGLVALTHIVEKVLESKVEE